MKVGMLASAAAAAAIAFAATPAAFAEPEWTTIKMEIDVNKSAKDVWAKVGGYCDLGKWLRAGAEVPCTVTSGTGEVGTVRSIANGAVIEVMTAKSEYGYGYAQPMKPGAAFYDHYHGFVEARPTGANTSKIIYTLMYDVSNLADKAAKDADVARRKAMFEGALKNMKAMAEK
jgi:hypothetical protein